jgi:transposase
LELSSPSSGIRRPQPRVPSPPGVGRTKCSAGNLAWHPVWAGKGEHVRARERSHQSRFSEDGSTDCTTHSGDTARAVIRRAKQVTYRRFPTEEKIRIVLEGVRTELSVAELCRREGVPPSVYYIGLKDFMEAGKKRLRGDTQREANRQEVEQLRKENGRLMRLVADLSLVSLTPKKSQY